MAGLADVIKQIVADYLENENLSDLAYGVYTGTGVKLDEKPNEAPMDFVEIPAHLQTVTGRLSCDLSGGFTIKAKDGEGKPVTVERITLTNVPVVLQTGLAPGTRVSVARQRGGQKYFIIDKAGPA